MSALVQKIGSPLNKFIFFSALGLFFFFVPVTIGGKSTIAIDHFVNLATHPSIRPVSTIYIIVMILVGCLLPFRNGSWSKSNFDIGLTGLKLLAVPLAVMYFINIGPAVVLDPKMLPFLFEKLAMPVGLLIPVGAVCLSFLTGYGLLEYFGVLMERIMRPIWKTPGRSAIDAIASFSGSYSVGILLTNKVYNEGRYSPKEAAIIATGFSTVSTPFMVVVAKTTGIMAYWNGFFWGTFVITFVVTAITVRLWPLRGMSNAKVLADEQIESGMLFRRAAEVGLEAAAQSPNLISVIKTDLIDGLKMTAAVVPAILSVGLIGLLVAEHTNFFQYLGYVFYPVTLLSGLENPLQASASIASGLAEMFLPALTSADQPLHTKFVIAIVSISSILFFSASIPCILATDIPIKIFDLVVIWFLRTALSIPLASLLAHLVLAT